MDASYARFTPTRSSARRPSRLTAADPGAMLVPSALKTRLLAASRVVLRNVFDLDVRGGDHVPATGKLLIVSNHVHRFLDPLVLAVATPRQVILISDVYFKRRPIAGVLAYLSDTIFVAPSPAMRPAFVM